MGDEVRAAMPARIARGLDRLGLEGGAELAGRLAAYLDLLSRWNRVYNLTAVRDPEQMVVLHLLDSLVALPFLRGNRVADVGSGAGLPGIPLALADPGRRFDLIEPAGKKCRFLEQARIALGLTHVTVRCERAEALRPGGYGSVVSRALGPARRVWEQAGHLLDPGGRMVLLKGRDPRAETKALPADAGRVQVTRVQVPDLDAERHIVTIDRA
jgi:16S rRNA (guanine527-N7)-methyltransferase